MDEIGIIDAPEKIINKIILEKRAYVIDSLEAYHRQVFKRQRADIYEVRTRLNSLFEEIAPALEESLSPEEYQDLRDSIHKGTDTDLLDAWEQINKFIYSKGLTNIFKKEEIL